MPWLNAILPLMKSSAFIDIVVAINPATSTCAPAPNTMPFGLEINTRPFAANWPRMLVGLPPVIRFRAIALWLA